MVSREGKGYRIRNKPAKMEMFTSIKRVNSILLLLENNKLSAINTSFDEFVNHKQNVQRARGFTLQHHTMESAGKGSRLEEVQDTSVRRTSYQTSDPV